LVIPVTVVFAGASVKDVPPVPVDREQVVGTLAPVELVGTLATDQGVLAIAAFDPVAGLLAVGVVPAGARAENVALLASDQIVGTGRTDLGTRRRGLRERGRQAERDEQRDRE